MDERAFVATSGRYGRHRTEGPTTIREMTKSVSVQALARLLALPDMYAGMISNGGQTFAGSDAIVADSDHAVLIHCTAGRPHGRCRGPSAGRGRHRSSVPGGRLRGLARATVRVWADGMRHALVRLGVPDLPEIEALMIASPASAIESVLDGPDAHGGAPAYLPIPPTPA